MNVQFAVATYSVYFPFIQLLGSIASAGWTCPGKTVCWVYVRYSVGIEMFLGKEASAQPCFQREKWRHESILYMRECEPLTL